MPSGTQALQLPRRPSTTSCGASITAQAGTRGALRAEQHGQGAHAHASVAGDRLEVVERHDAVRAQPVEQRQQQDAPVRARAPERDGGPGDPGRATRTRGPQARLPSQPFCLKRSGGALYAQARTSASPWRSAPSCRAANPRRGPARSTRGRARSPRCPGRARGDRPIGLVERVDVAIEPVVDHLAGAADERAGEADARGPARPTTPRAAGRHHAARERPHGRKPRDGLEQRECRARLRQPSYGERDVSDCHVCFTPGVREARERRSRCIVGDQGDPRVSRPARSPLRPAGGDAGGA
jgi:hypothetical protein